MADRSLRFNNLLHHVTVPRLELAYRSLRKDAASGVDEQDWASYGVGLAERLVRVHQLVQSGRYQPQPVLRQWALKPDGRKRPLGVTCVEDKVVQKALAGVLEAIFEVDFLGFSYGFRPGRSQHDALDAVYMAITTRKVSWVLDADIEACFDRIEHGHASGGVGPSHRGPSSAAPDRADAPSRGSGRWKVATEYGWRTTRCGDFTVVGQRVFARRLSSVGEWVARSLKHEEWCPSFAMRTTSSLARNIAVTRYAYGQVWKSGWRCMV